MQVFNILFLLRIVQIDFTTRIFCFLGIIRELICFLAALLPLVTVLSNVQLLGIVRLLPRMHFDNMQILRITFGDFELICTELARSIRSIVYSWNKFIVCRRLVYI
jgi:hypothetical protein